MSLILCGCEALCALRFIRVSVFVQKLVILCLILGGLNE